MAGRHWAPCITSLFAVFRKEPFLRMLPIRPNNVSMAVSRGEKIEDIKKILKQLLRI